MAGELEQAAGEIGTALAVGLGRFFRSAWNGCRNLKRRPAQIGLGISLLGTGAAYLMQGKILAKGWCFPGKWLEFLRYPAYWMLLFLPVFYLAVLGAVYKARAERYFRYFEQIGFRGKDGKYPLLLGQKKEGKITTYTFCSIIPLDGWQNCREELETVFDFKIREIRQAGSKQCVEVSAIPSDFKIPEKLPWSDEKMEEEEGVLCLGEDETGKLTINLNKDPHISISGETGSGKSVLIRGLLWQVIYKKSKVYMLDFKGGIEFGKDYEQFGAVVTEREPAADLMEELAAENERRMALIREARVKNLPQYNAKTGENMPRICIFCDEVAEMLDRKGIRKEDREPYDRIEAATQSIARLGRATGLHLVLGAQRPDATIINGQIKINLTVRISGLFKDKQASIMALGNTAACYLPDIKGRFMFKRGNETVEFQSYLFDDERDLKTPAELGWEDSGTEQDSHAEPEGRPKISLHKTPEPDAHPEPDSHPERTISLYKRIRPDTHPEPDSHPEPEDIFQTAENQGYSKPKRYQKPKAAAAAGSETAQPDSRRGKCRAETGGAGQKAAAVQTGGTAGRQCCRPEKTGMGSGRVYRCTGGRHSYKYPVRGDAEGGQLETGAQGCEKYLPQYCQRKPAGAGGKKTESQGFPERKAGKTGTECPAEGNTGAGTKPETEKSEPGRNRPAGTHGFRKKEQKIHAGTKIP